MKEKVKKYIGTAKEKYHSARAFFSKTYNKHIIYMYVVTELLINLVI